MHYVVEYIIECRLSPLTEELERLGLQNSKLWSVTKLLKDSELCNVGGGGGRGMREGEGNGGGRGGERRRGERGSCLRY